MIIEYSSDYSKGSDQTARMRMLIWGFAGRTYHIVGNIMLRLKWCCMYIPNLKATGLKVEGRKRGVIVLFIDYFISLCRLLVTFENSLDPEKAR